MMIFLSWVVVAFCNKEKAQRIQTHNYYVNHIDIKNPAVPQGCEAYDETTGNKQSMKVIMHHTAHASIRVLSLIMPQNFAQKLKIPLTFVLFICAMKLFKTTKNASSKLN